MSFLDELAAFLESVQAGEVEDLRISETATAGHLGELERWFTANSGDPDDGEALARGHAVWLEHCRRGLLDRLYERVAVQFPDPARRARLVELALATLIEDDRECRAAGVPNVVAELGAVRANTLHALAKDVAIAFKRYVPRMAPSARRVAGSLALTRLKGAMLELTAAGTLFLQFGRRERLRWLLALELAGSEGPRERDRLHVDLGRRLRDRGRVGIDGYQTVWSSVLSHSWEHEHLATLDRWTALGVLEDSDVHPYTGEPYVHDAANPPDKVYALTAIGHALLDDLLSDTPHPLRELALAMLADEEAALPPGFRWPIAGQSANTRALVRYSKILTHEVRNVLLPVQFASQQLGERLDGAELASTHGHLRTIKAGLSRIFDFVDNWRFVMEQAEEPGALFSIVAAVRDAIAASQHQLERPVELRVGTGAERIEVFGTRHLFTQVMIELCRNAVQAGGPRVQVSIEVDHDGAKVSIAISDDGPGVLEADRERIFRRGVTLRPHGTGQGLADARDIVRDMSGDIRVEDGAGGGTRFVVTLPCHTQETT